MITDISSLTASASFWDEVSVWSAVAVFAGVAVESVADFDSLAKLARLTDAGRRKRIANAGLLLLIAALAVEVAGAVGSHTANEQIISVLNTELRATIEQATGLERLTKELRLSNDELRRETAGQSGVLGHTGTELEALSKQSGHIENDIRAQKSRSDAALASLKQDEDRLAKAQAEFDTNTGKAAAAAQGADKALSDMNKALADVQAMRERMKEIITPRQIDDGHFNAVVAAIKPYAKTTIDFAVNQDAESLDLLVRISDAAKAAGWEIRAWQAGGLSLSVSSRPDLPSIGEVTARGVQFTVAEGDVKKLGDAGNAFIKALINAGIPVIGWVVTDKMPDGKPNPRAAVPGAIHVVIGSKS